MLSTTSGRNGRLLKCLRATTTQGYKRHALLRTGEHLAVHGTEGLQAAESEELHTLPLAEWQALTERATQVLMNYRLAYLGETVR